MITSGQLRIIWDQFWQERRHVRSNPASLINSGREDAITLFNVAGMQPLVRSLIKDFSVDGKRILIFDRTPFYAKSGGQKVDTGTISLDSGEKVNVIDVQKYGGVWLHCVG